MTMVLSVNFFHQWLEVEGFNKFVIDSWIVAPGDKSNGMRNLMLKLRFMKAKIREWNHEIRINSKAEFHRLKKDLQVMDAELDNGKGSAEVVNRRMEVVNSLHRGVWKTNVSKEELKRAVWDCRVDKSPGPDGFSFGFYRHFWSTIENDVFEAVNHFRTHGDIPKGCNSSFIILIPKVLNANMVKDFRPISLIESIYKIIAKILANRLVNVLDILSTKFSAFKRRDKS
ncbi:hypothetical protein Tco_0968549 [Tanacetum coccineum]